LQGHGYHQLPLHPFTLAELEHKNNTVKPADRAGRFRPKHAPGAFSTLFTYGGFPNRVIPKQNETLFAALHNEKCDRMFREDIADLAVIRDLGQYEDFKRPCCLEACRLAAFHHSMLGRSGGKL